MTAKHDTVVEETVVETTQSKLTKQDVLLIVASTVLSAIGATVAVFATKTKTKAVNKVVFTEEEETTREEETTGSQTVQKSGPKPGPKPGGKKPE